MMQDLIDISLKPSARRCEKVVQDGGVVRWGRSSRCNSHKSKQAIWNDVDRQVYLSFFF